MKWFLSLNTSNKIALVGVLLVLITLIYSIVNDIYKTGHGEQKTTFQVTTGDNNLLINNNKGSINVPK